MADQTKQAQNIPQIEKKTDGTIVLNITVSASIVEETRSKVIDELAKQVEAPGFRKGAVPKNVAEAKLSKDQIKEEILKKVLTDEYVKAIKDEGINPIINPRIHIEQFDEGTDLKFTAETCESPKITLGNYKAEIAKIKPADPKIIVPGKDEGPQTGEQKPGKKLDEILEKILSITDATIPQILIEQEVNRLLSQLVDEVKKLGMTIEQYLNSRGMSEEKIREEYKGRAQKDLKLEFILRKIAEEEKITVEEADIKAALESIKDERQKAELVQNPYIVASIIRQQKTLDFLSKL